MKGLIYCHRNWKESAKEWEERRQLCRRASKELGLLHALETEDFPTLQRLCLREGYQHVVVPSVMQTPPDVVLWLRQNRVRIHDAMRLLWQAG
ncbi:MAG: hypothetical protein RMK92_07530 [Armatimonadota bacterium]|nr:hypothetical protein [Armatimonadota bacterium]